MSDDTPEPTEAAMDFERQRYPRASEETRRLLYHARNTIRRFLDSDLGLERPRDASDPMTDH